MAKVAAVLARGGRPLPALRLVLHLSDGLFMRFGGASAMSAIHPPTGQPIGPAVDPQPAERPQALTLSGRHGAVERLNPSKHRASLWPAVRGHDRLWTYMAHGPFVDETAFSDWLTSREASADPYYYTVVDRSGRAAGLITLCSIRPDMRVVEVGHILLAPSLQRTALATEAQFLLARYAFEMLRYRRYEWKCDAFNAASRQAALRLGFSFEGIFRQHMIIKGHSRDTAWYAMLEAEWPARKAAFERWLSPQNFTSGGMQKKKLAELQSAAG
jgi:RimJ/RimL family protein N-acetyltransferase